MTIRFRGDILRTPPVKFENVYQKKKNRGKAFFFHFVLHLLNPTSPTSVGFVGSYVILLYTADPRNCCTRSALRRYNTAGYSNRWFSTRKINVLTVCLVITGGIIGGNGSCSCCIPCHHFPPNLYYESYVIVGVPTNTPKNIEKSIFVIFSIKFKFLYVNVFYLRLS